MQVKIALAKVAHCTLCRLYWTGKSSATDTFTASRQVQSGTRTVNTNSTVGDNQSITDLIIALQSMGNSGSWPIYTFSGNGNTYAFEFNNTPTITVSVNGGAATNIPLPWYFRCFVLTATLTTPMLLQMEE
jgi:hypothetical protein